MSNAANEPRRWTLYRHGATQRNVTLDRDPLMAVHEVIEVVDAAAYDALLAERDALLAWLADSDAMHAMLPHDNAALRAELAALREKAERLHVLVRAECVGGADCYTCYANWRNSLEWHAPDCPASPDFLTTSATESREAKGGKA